METLDLAVQTLFQEFYELVLKRAALEEKVKKEGTITRKMVKGREYWYRQHTLQGRLVQEYLGPSTSPHREKILALKEDQAGRRKQIRLLVAQERRRIPLLRRAGLMVLDPDTTSLVERLSRLRLIYKGGVLVGSYAFASYGGMLGRLFDKESMKTLDLDVARDADQISQSAQPISLVNAEGLIAIRGKNFYSVPGLSLKARPSSFVGPGGLRVDFLAPLKGRPTESIPFRDLPQVGGQPLRFLDYLIKKPVDAVLLGTRVGVPVTVPDPCRHAIHKLIVAARRPPSETAKRQKDLAQAAQLLLCCSEERPHELKRAYQEAIARGRGWAKAISDSLKMLPPHAAGIPLFS